MSQFNKLPEDANEQHVGHEHHHRHSHFVTHGMRNENNLRI